ncbi:lysozyme [Duganella vulcania]|uniref:Lysozyme n=1 Tax=Duganella vulcania TaxID=2692166 RepID=A0A845GU55_9BURK|nr:lysozyme [Duganella vulcania]MYM97581.1 glycoside hydrolase family protein [Duganella vulcania]
MNGRRSLLRLLALAPAAPLLHACAQPGVATLAGKPTNAIFLDDDSTRAVLPQGEALRPLPAKGLQLTKVSEGWVDHLYNDAAGYCTVGYGHLCYKKRCDGATPRPYLHGIDEPAGSDLLLADMRKAQVEVQAAIPDHLRLLNDFQYAALCDFTFNAGGANFRESTLLKVVLARQFDRVPGQLRRWVLAGGKEFAGLKTRREGEIALFFEGTTIPRGVPRQDEDLSPLDIVRR